ncbi:MAG TPA: hypothetical protein VGB05_04785, partial [Pyrinomonadaceae bacterium]
MRRESPSDAAQAHLTACADCRVLAAERLALRRLIGGLEKISAPADFDFRMRARMASERGVAAPRATWFNFSPAALSWPLAACLALVVSASLYFQQRRPDTTPTLSPEQARVATPSPQTSIAEVASRNDQTGSKEIRPSVETTSTEISLVPKRGRAAPSRPGMRSTGVERELSRIEESTATSLM